MTLVVNLFGGPGIGKSTIAASVFVNLKRCNVEVEMAHEYAKDLTWEDRKKAISFQPYVCAKQMYRIHRLIGEVDVIITDSPILLSLIYRGEGCPDSFDPFVLDIFNSWDTYNILLKRQYPYSEKGRRQILEEAIRLDRVIETFLDTSGIGYVTSRGAPQDISNRIMNRL